MGAKFTIKQLEELKAKGTIKGFAQVSCENIPQEKKKNIPVHKEWLTLNLREWCKAKRLELVEELKFHPERKWRFDFALPSLKIAIEYEGLAYHRTHHTSSDGYTKNTDKYNAATALGWKVFRYTFKNYKTVFDDLEQASR